MDEGRVTSDEGRVTSDEKDTRPPFGYSLLAIGYSE